MKTSLDATPRRRGALGFCSPRHLLRAAGALAIWAALAPALRADDWEPNLTMSTAWQDNATNADRSGDEIGALQTRADLVGSQRYDFGSHDSFHPGFHAGAEWWPRFHDLSILAVGGRAEWRHKFGLGALAPVLSATASGDVLAASEIGRRGTDYGVSFELRKRFNDVWRGTLTQSFDRLDAHDAVYDHRAAQTTVEIARDVSDVARLTLAAFWREGDVVSYATPPRPDLVALASNRLLVETFGRPMMAYSIDAHTLGGRIGLIRALDPSSAAVLGYEYRSSEHGPLRYGNQLVSLALVTQF